MENNQKDKVLIARIMDKVTLSRKRNRITYTDFLNEYEIKMVEKELRKNKIENFIFIGGYENSERKILIIYPEHMDENLININLKSILKSIKIELPSEIKGKLQHRNYLGTLLSFGLAKERIGDIIVYEDSCYIIVLNENAQYLKNSLEYEKLLKKAKISVISIDEIKAKEIEFEEIVISVNSIRIDNILSELLKISRKNSQELIEDERVSVNYSVIQKVTKTLQEEDILVIRGYGKYIVDEFLGKNKKDKECIRIKKYK